MNMAISILHHLPGQPIKVYFYYALRASAIDFSLSKKDMTVVIREGSKDDIDALVSCTDKRGRFLDRFTMGDHCLIAMDMDVVVGYLWFSDRDVFREEQSKYTFRIQNDTVYSYDVYVRPQYRQHGVLSQFFAVIYDWMKQYSKNTITILIDFNNDISIKAHVKKGFVPFKKILCISIYGKSLFIEQKIPES